MKVEEPLLVETLRSSFLKEDEEELEETLSLCDLPLYSDQSADWDQEQHSSLNSNSTSTSSQQDFFEFSSQELSPSATTAAAAAYFPPENIIFCGKLIPYKQLPPCKTDATKQVEIKKSSRWRWKLPSKRQSPSLSKNGNKGTTALMHQPHKRMYNSTKQLGGKAKWHFFLFGVSRFSPVVELSDIRNRQSRRCRSQSPPLSPPSSPPPPSLMFGFRNDKVSDRSGWGLWGLIRALSCGGNHYPTAVVTVASGGAPPE